MRYDHIITKYILMKICIIFSISSPAAQLIILLKSDIINCCILIEYVWHFKKSSPAAHFNIIQLHKKIAILFLFILICLYYKNSKKLAELSALICKILQIMFACGAVY